MNLRDTTLASSARETFGGEDNKMPRFAIYYARRSVRQRGRYEVTRLGQ
jgi:hypothetical protein